ncbi:MAG: exonuclease domain-containing protein [Cytophaga sp.]|uniref:exonuclease domain-containing protein n=1 Tax=Cytophaga sp. TaxID=29535 RepID=UPI003F818811
MIYSIVDIETTGGHASGNRIIEIAIYNFDGEKIIDSYHTLINPERRIPVFITSLTGIDNEMVAQAPVFADVAEEILDFTKDSIFVAHNVNFDFTFIKKEFQALDIPFNRSKLCTIRLSRKIFPGLPSYSLGNLCASLNIHVQDRHRASGDAEATVRLLHKLLLNDTEKFISKSLKKNSKETLLPAHLPREQFDKLPETFGVYYFHDRKGKVIYVGKANNIKKRVISHFSGKQTNRKSQQFMQNIHSVNFEVCGSELLSLLLESHEIKKYFPIHNSAQKISGKNYGIYQYEDHAGFIRLSIAQVNKSQQPLMSFPSIGDARSFLLEKVREHQLCHRRSGLQTADCSEIHACTACSGTTKSVAYNVKMKRALASFKEEKYSYLIKQPGRSKDEYGVIVVENGRYLGFAYIPNDLTGNTVEEFKTFVNRHPDNADIQKILAMHRNKESGYISLG